MTETTGAAPVPVPSSGACECWPEPERLGEFIKRAQAGEFAVPVVGDGSPDTQIGCAHGSWRLGDLLPRPACTEETKAGEPCKGTPGPDGRCAAHKEA